MGKNPVVAVIAVVVLLAAVWFIARQMGLGGSGGKAPVAFWYDLKTGKLFGGPNTTDPVQAPSGGEAVRAHVFACNDCADANDRFIGYLEKFTDEARQVLVEQKGAPMARAMAMEYVKVRRADDTEWVNGGDPEGIEIMTEYLSKCGGKQPPRCAYQK